MNSHTVVAFILSFGVAVTIIILAVETVIHSGTISEQEASLLSTVLGAIVGAIASYLGFSRGGEQESRLNNAPEKQVEFPPSLREE